MNIFNVAIVGGGPGGLAVMDMIFEDRLRLLRMNLIGIADTDPEAPALTRAASRAIFTTHDYRDLFRLDGLDLIIELTGNPQVSLAVQREKPEHVRLMDHTIARLFWDVFRLEGEKHRAKTDADVRIKEERDHTARILDNLSDAVVVMDDDSRIRHMNKAFLRDFALPGDRVAEEPWREILSAFTGPHTGALRPPPDPSAPPSPADRKEFMFLRDGTQAYYEVDYTPLVGGGVPPGRRLLSIRDISDRKKLELKLERSQKKYKDLFDNAREGFALFDSHGRIVESNFSLASMLGYSKQELEHMNIADPALHASGAVLEDHLDGLKILGFTSVEMEFMNKRGEPVPVEANIMWLPDESLFRIMVRDITIKKKIEESRRIYSLQLEEEVGTRTRELEASEREIRRQKRTAEGIIYGSPTPMFVLDADHRIIYWNRACEELTGFPSSEMIGTDRHWEPFYTHKKPLLADIIVDDDPEMLSRVKETMALRESPVVDGAYETEVFLPHLGSKGTHLYVSAAPIKDERGTIQGAIVTYQDVSKRVAMTEDLKASEEETARQKKTAEGIIYGSPIPMFVLDGRHRITHWNKACESLTGCSSSEMIGTDTQWKPFYPGRRPLLADLVMDNDLETIQRLYGGMNLRPSPMVKGAYEAEHFFPYLGEHGTHLHINAAPITGEHGAVQGAIVTYQNVSERVHMTQELKSREAFVKNLIQNSLDGIIATDASGTIVVFNRGAMDITGYVDSDIIGRLSYRDILPEGSDAPLREAFLGHRYGPPGKIIHMETHLLATSAEAVPVRLSGTLLYEDNREVGSVVFVQDLREIHRLEREKAQAQRMAAIGGTVAGLAHYIKNILSGLQGGAYVINSALSKKNLDLVQSGWDMVERNIDQIGSIVHDMLIYSKDRKPRYEMVDVNELVIEVLELIYQRSKAAGVTLVRSLAADLDRVAMDRTALHRCLLNLITNAVDACTLEGIVRGRGIVTVHTDTVPGWAVRFRVSDNGTGMDEPTQKRLFTDFFTTKGYKGTGLGLPVTQKIIKEHGGMLTLDSRPGQGTTFTVLLPHREL